jgi:hypothetical protein
MRDNIDLEYFKNRLEERLKDITDAKKMVSPLGVGPVARWPPVSHGCHAAAGHDPGGGAA